MVLTLWGRVLTRALMVVVLGVPWVAVATPLFDRRPFMPVPTDLALCYYANYSALALVLTAGLGWDLCYHLIAQRRWDRDWPSLLALLVGVNEGLLSWYLGAGPLQLPLHPLGYGAMFGLLWLAMWGVAQGPLRVVFVHWRFAGGVPG